MLPSGGRMEITQTTTRTTSDATKKATRRRGPRNMPDPVIGRGKLFGDSAGQMWMEELNARSVQR